MSTSSRLIAIVAYDEKYVMGNKGKLPWHIPEDLKWFRETTRGHAILMGRKTFDSLGKPLPDRTNIVLSHSMPPQPNVRVLRSIQDVWDLEFPEIYIIGGAEIFNIFLPYCQQLLITHVEGTHEGDVFFPRQHLLLFKPDQTLAEFSEAKIISYKKL